MTPETIQFQCGYCSTTLTVPAQMAGVSGPCPSCGNTVTSPTPMAASAPVMAAQPQWPPMPAPAPAAAAPPPAWNAPPAAPAPQMEQQPQFPQGGMFGGGGSSGGGLPPKRAPGQSPLTASLPAGPGAPAWGAPPAGGMNAGSMPANGGALPNHSRLIPGAPVLPSGTSGGGSLGQGGIPGSLLGREVASAPIRPMTQPLQQVPMSGSLGLGGGGGFGSAPPSSQSPSHPQASMPAGRKMANLREPRGASFLRLAFAALFLLGFLGVVGFFLKDYLPPSVLSLLQRGDAEEAPAIATPSIPTATPTLPTPPVMPRQAAENPPSITPPPKEIAPAPMGFDPLEGSPAKTTIATAEPAPPAETIATPVIPTAVPETGKPLDVASVGSSSDASSAPAALASPPGTVLTSEDGEGSIPEKAKPAAEALRKFLSATTLEERLRHTLGADLMQPLMERYYARSQEGAVIVDRIQFLRLEPNPELGSGSHCIFSLENKTWEFPVPVMLEEQPDGYKVDWLSFVEFKDRLLEKFFKGYQEGSIRAHVGIMRHHYFEDGVPNADRKDAFRITPAPPNTFQASAFIDKDSAFGQEMRKRLPWDKHTWAIVDLEWKKLGTQQWVEVTAMPQTHWYSLPPRPVSAAQQPSSQPGTSPKEMPAGISKNGVGSGGAAKSNPPPKGISKSTPGLPGTIKRPLPAGR